MRLIDADAINPDMKTFLSSYSEELIKSYSQKVIDNAPTIEAEPVKHGHWLTWEDKFPGKIPKKKNKLGVFCSECELHADNMSTYCPNCGAKMNAAQNIDTCICCGEIIPEGRQVCPKCEKGV